MIHIFTHYVPRRLIALAVLDALVLLIAAYVGLSLNLAGPGLGVLGATVTVPSQAGAFALGMMVVMSSMGLYQPDLWTDSPSTRARLAIAFLLPRKFSGLMRRVRSESEM